jgi:predicted HAD superfamily Cof-like phosphohydrolase
MPDTEAKDVLSRAQKKMHEHDMMQYGPIEHRHCGCLTCEVTRQLAAALEAQQKAERERDGFFEGMMKVYGVMIALLESADIGWEGERDGRRVEYVGIPRRIEKLITQRDEARAEVQRLSGQVEELGKDKASRMVREFHETYGVPIMPVPSFPSHERCALRESLLEEEWIELREAQAKRDIVEVADALADMLYIIHGTALEYGIPLDSVVSEVHRSNMSKLGADGKPIMREDGKVLKGPNYFKPDVAGVLAAMGASGEGQE